MIKVQWYYKKQDLDLRKLGINDEDLEFIGENEVFPSKHYDKIFADAIMAKCRVVVYMRVRCKRYPASEGKARDMWESHDAIL